MPFVIILHYTYGIFIKMKPGTLALTVMLPTSICKARDSKFCVALIVPRRLQIIYRVAEEPRTCHLRQWSRGFYLILKVQSLFTCLLQIETSVIFETCSARIFLPHWSQCSFITRSNLQRQKILLFFFLPLNIKSTK